MCNNQIQWTDNKTALVEFIYALNATGSINNWRSEIRELAAFFEQAFNIRLTDIYRTCLEIKIRSTPTKFIDNLKAALLSKMDEDYLQIITLAVFLQSLIDTLFS